MTNTGNAQKNNFSLPFDGAHLWCLDIHQVSSSFYNRLLNCLSVDEKKKADDFKFEKDRSVFVLARGILRHLLASYLGRSPSDIVFNYNLYGKPFLAHDSKTGDIQFNLSHSKDMIVYAFSLGKLIGIDVEYVKTELFNHEMVQQILSLKEQSKFYKIPEEKQALSFFRVLVCKESIIKALGYGFSYSPLDVELDISTDKITLFQLGKDKVSSQQWVLNEFSPVRNYVGAVTIKGKTMEVITYLQVSEDLFT